MFLVHSSLDGHGLLVQVIDVYEFFLLLFNTNFYLFSKEKKNNNHDSSVSISD